MFGEIKTEHPLISLANNRFHIHEVAQAFVGTTHPNIESYKGRMLNHLRHIAIKISSQI